MKKLFLIFAMLVLPAAATDIPYGNNGYNSTTCNSGVLQNDSGTVRLRARYEPNQININWYNGDTKLNSTSCDYGGDLNILSVSNVPTRPGYTFKGWKLDRSCGLKNVDRAIKATSRCFRELDGTKKCFLGANYDLTENGTWAVVFSYGTVLGEVLCSTTPYYEARIGNPNTNDTGDYCWCRITGYIQPEGGICSTTSGWMAESIASGETCINSCAARCAYRIHVYDHHRNPLYNSLPE